jgi:SAM-dependent methyltransferase
MSPVARERVNALTSLASAKNNLGLPLADLDALDQVLSDQWQIDFVLTDLDLREHVERNVASPTREEFLAAYDSAAQSLRKGGSEDAIYARMSTPSLLGLVTSKRRHFLLDSVALAVSLLRQLRIDGPILDAGCHAGVASHALAQLVPNPIIGIDPIAEAIEYANERADPSGRVSFVRAGLPWKATERFECVMAIDSMPGGAGDRAMFLRGVSDLLVDGGVAMIVSNTWVEADAAVLRRQLSGSQLGFAMADVVGGFGGMPTQFAAEGVLVLVKGASESLPRRLRDAMESDWPSFRDYANAPGVPARMKTQAFKRSKAKAA